MLATIVFVHLGTKIPPYLKKNISRTRLIFPKIKLVLVCDSASNPGKNWDVDCDVFEYDQSELSHMGVVVPELLHDHKFWDGYWQHTFKRLFAIGAYQKSAPHERILHLESDVILFKSFPIGEFSKINHLAWPQVSKSYSVASIVYSPSFANYLFLMKELVKFAMTDPLTNDMQALSNFASSHPDKYFSLPTKLDCSEAESQLQPGIETLNPFSGVFDGLTLGYWFTGRDSRDAWGVRSRYLVPLNSPLDYSLSKFQVDSECNLYMDSTPVYCLHVHSKNLGYFEFPNHDFLSKEVDLVNKRKNRHKFELAGFVKTLQTHGVEYIKAAFTPKKWSNLFNRIFRSE